MAAADDAINFTIDPKATPTLAVDGYLISSNEHVVTLSFAQSFMDGKQQHVVSRVSMTPGQIKEFLEKLSDHIQKFEV